MLHTFFDIEEELKDNQDIIQIFFYTHSGRQDNIRNREGTLFLSTSIRKWANVSIDGDIVYELIIPPAFYDSYDCMKLSGFTTSNIASPGLEDYSGAAEAPKRILKVYGCRSDRIAKALGRHFGLKGEGIYGSCIFPVIDGVPTPVWSIPYRLKENLTFENFLDTLPADPWYATPQDAFQ